MILRSIIKSMILLCLCPMTALAVENIDPLDDGSQYAWGESVGWFNAEPRGDGGPGVNVAGDKLTGWMWSESIGWISLSCENTSSCGTFDYGVTNDGDGNLSGYAWSESAGWINFAPDYGGVSIDELTGRFDGYAWGESIGWMKFRDTKPVEYNVRTAWGLLAVSFEPKESIVPLLYLLEMFDHEEPESAP
ncbi:MAG: hypothetical protein SWE60_05945 [Thermodesulfobacteriota bacterium]|nr:hypothetical protein [Thermodesulfobacteriota bacterium]